MLNLQYLSQTELLFANTDIIITEQSQRHLCRYSSWFLSYIAEKYVLKKVTDWITRLRICLLEIAQTHPHSAYHALTCGLINCWKYAMRMIPDIAPLIAPLEDAIHLHLISGFAGY